MEKQKILLQASRAGNLRLIKSLIEAGVSIIERDNEVLAAAVRNGHEAIVDYLLTFPAVIDDILIREFWIFKSAILSNHCSIIDKIFNFLNIQEIEEDDLTELLDGCLFICRQMDILDFLLRKIQDGIDFFHLNPNDRWFDVLCTACRTDNTYLFDHSIQKTNLINRYDPWLDPREFQELASCIHTYLIFDRLLEINILKNAVIRNSDDFLKGFLETHDSDLIIRLLNLKGVLNYINLNVSVLAGLFKLNHLGIIQLLCHYYKTKEQIKKICIDHFFYLKVNSLQYSDEIIWTFIFEQFNEPSSVVQLGSVYNEYALKSAIYHSNVIFFKEIIFNLNINTALLFEFLQYSIKCGTAVEIFKILLNIENICKNVSKQKFYFFQDFFSNMHEKISNFYERSYLTRYFKNRFQSDYFLSFPKLENKHYLRLLQEAINYSDLTKFEMIGLKSKIPDSLREGSDCLDIYDRYILTEENEENEENEALYMDILLVKSLQNVELSKKDIEELLYYTGFLEGDRIERALGLLTSYMDEDFFKWMLYGDSMYCWGDIVCYFYYTILTNLIRRGDFNLFKIAIQNTKILECLMTAEYVDLDNLLLKIIEAGNVNCLKEFIKLEHLQQHVYIPIILRLRDKPHLNEMEIWCELFRLQINQGILQKNQLYNNQNMRFVSNTLTEQSVVFRWISACLLLTECPVFQVHDIRLKILNFLSSDLQGNQSDDKKAQALVLMYNHRKQQPHSDDSISSDNHSSKISVNRSALVSPLKLEI